ncbi:MAG: hypothetical protein HYZ00_01235 [Candidatus Hydrogenedentes bacterium]|nr:hypothetical protein [Candidatus Hydrogenedentota bacterium]
MSRISRLAQFITPAPFRKRETPPPAPSSALRRLERPSLSSQLMEPLKALLCAPASEGAAAQRALTELKSLAKEYGLYNSALELKARLDATRHMGPEGVTYYKSRGYVLAADFIMAHVHRELEAFKRGLVPLGPNVFKTYCNDLFECLLNGEKPQRAVEIPVLLIDELPANALGDPHRAPFYIEFAQRAIESLLENVTFHLRAATPKPGEFLTPPPLAGLMHENVLAHLAQVGEFVRRAAREFDQRRLTPPPGGSVAQADPAQVMTVFANLAQQANYLGFRAAFKQRMAERLHASDQEKSEAVLAEAARDWETLGDRELELDLRKLVLRRYTLAEQAFQQAGLTHEAEAIAAKRAAL